MRCFSIILCLLIVSVMVHAQRPGGLWHGQERVLRYHPEGGDFVIVNGERRFNRALYGTNTAFRVEAGDLPEFAMYLPGMGGCFRLGLVGGDSSRWLIRAADIRAVYRPGSMIYTIKDPLLGRGSLMVTVLALAETEGFVVKVTAVSVDAGVRLVVAFGGVSGKKFPRDGDIGADPESSFYLDPANCKGNQFVFDGARFRLSHGVSGVLEGVFPEGVRLKVADAERQGSPLEFYSSGGSLALAPALAGELPLTAGDRYFLICNGKAPSMAAPALFEQAEAARRKLAERVVVETPDPFINTLGGALAVAADGIWEDPSYLHGAVAWRQRLPAWRGPYVADPLGWHGRARRHFSAYALSQVVSPEEGPVVADTALHLARQLEKMGTSLFSSGYICRNPGGDLRPHHYDMNLVFIDQLLDHFCWTGDTAYVRMMWPVLQRHLAWEKRNFDSDDDGLYDAYCCIWASDALEYGGGGVTHSSAYNYRANHMAAELAEMIGEDGTPYRKEAEKILRAINHTLWMEEKGSYAEYVDWAPGDPAGGARAGEGPMLHPAAGLWTIYTAIDSRVSTPFQAWQALRYIDTDIPHIPVRAKGLDDTTLFTLSTTNWQPYTWSINNVVLAESLHTALAYWQGGRADVAYPLWKGALVESMYLGESPGNFQQLSFYDAMRGELYRDFGDPIGMAARSLVEGLFGIHPDGLHDTVRVEPGWPMDWGKASLRIPDMGIDFVRDGDRDRYTVVSDFARPMNLCLRLRARADRVLGVVVNGKAVGWRNVDDAIGGPVLEVRVGAKAGSVAAAGLKYVVEVKWGGESLGAAGLVEPGLAEPGAAESGLAGNKMVFKRVRQGDFQWWRPVGSFVGSTQRREVALVKGGSYDTVNLRPYFNDRVTNIFKNQYRSPRPATPTLQLPVQGIGNWCYPLVTAGIDDSGLRAGVIVLPSGVPFATSLGRNIVFTSRWDNYPDSVVVGLSGKARHAWFLLAGTTNPMQSHVVNGVVVVRYKDGTEDRLELVNPENWWPIEQDYYEDGFAFRTGAVRPVRVLLKSGKVEDGGGGRDGQRREWGSIKGFSNMAIDGGAATVLDIPLRPGKELDRLVLRARARDVVVGLMGLTLLRN